MTQKYIDLGFKYFLYAFIAALTLSVFRFMCYKLKDKPNFSTLKAMPDILEGFAYLLSAWLLVFNFIHIPIEDLPNRIAALAIFFALNTSFSKFLKVMLADYDDYNKIEIERLKESLGKMEKDLIRLQHKK